MLHGAILTNFILHFVGSFHPVLPRNYAAVMQAVSNAAAGSATADLSAANASLTAALSAAAQRVPLTSAKLIEAYRAAFGSSTRLASTLSVMTAGTTSVTAPAFGGGDFARECTLYLFNDALILGAGGQALALWPLATTWVRLLSDASGVAAAVVAGGSGAAATPPSAGASSQGTSVAAGIVEIRTPNRSTRRFYLLAGNGEEFMENARQLTSLLVNSPATTSAAGSSGAGSGARRSPSPSQNLQLAVALSSSGTVHDDESGALVTSSSGGAGGTLNPRRLYSRRIASHQFDCGAVYSGPFCFV